MRTKISLKSTELNKWFYGLDTEKQAIGYFCKYGKYCVMGVFFKHVYDMPDVDLHTTGIYAKFNPNAKINLGYIEPLWDLMSLVNNGTLGSFEMSRLESTYKKVSFNFSKVKSNSSHTFEEMKGIILDNVEVLEGV